MAVANLRKLSPTFNLPLTKGDDLFFVFIYKTVLKDEEGEPILDENNKKQFVVADYPEGSVVELQIDDAEGNVAVTVEGDIDGSEATFWEDYTVTDLIPAKRLWRVKITYSNTRDKVMCKGMTTRDDGKS